MESISSASIESNSNLLHFDYTEIPVTADIETIKITITDTQTGSSRSITIHPQWHERNYTYFERHNIPDDSLHDSEPFKTALDFIYNFTDVDMEHAQEYFHPNYRDNFYSSVLEHDQWEYPRDDFLSYEGSSHGYQDVFSYSLGFRNNRYKADPVTVMQKIYLVFADNKWQIIDITGRLLFTNYFNDDYQPPEYNPQKSITYNKAYADLSSELLYARLQENTGEGKKTVRIIRDKQDLIEIYVSSIN